ncbi:MAG TPA: transcription antitermination factor NusB [Spirochaetota bacterium]|nr:transcription antitermination factor NusB [Spirochaetota bacterium]HNT12047.1 transcription antitermination factor NusB [Spirochaetota bacterium]HOS41100.1 transcription antitermination factor NusB [Spirochaetota bacterium]HPI22846.1 transcription antitermination factor NusB [Spirochaetota bacterium]HPU88757.1 transcription antitermination factor NusB [Spirochaetota bacterium]
MGHRRKAREFAMQALYMHETVERAADALSTLDWVDRDVTADIRAFAIRLIEGSIERREYIDGLIRKHSKNWKFERISAVDKSILRISIYAMLFIPDIPLAVTINEGIELAKAYGGNNSGQFVNGILDAIKKSERADAREPGGGSGETQ